ncbi:helix-turn-helix domain-containing protein [Desulfofundulus thermobenzoicus]|uniref:Helix-turn-helix domain-containing protein n=1 Tax=Desulfofundulus thermobenzoicus TaxID=29376 RepID=A0A6N7IQD3_9FIRM|nr:helix-turn-helix domain-containing protein [Desulfofundulus thermobenzoicus]MQL52285.1 helix-turn-helix domain-containing protein [Desulfofundulus thermobenzoicus]
MGESKGRRRELAYSLLFGIVENLRELWEMTRRSGIENPPNYVTLWETYDARELHQRSELWKISLRKKIEQAFDEIVGDGGLYCFVAEGMALLINSRHWGDPGEDLSRLVEAKEQLEQCLGAGFVVGVGRPYGDMRHLTLSYREAVQALTHRGTGGEPAIYYFESADPHLFSTEQLVNLRRAIVNGEVEPARQMMKNMREKIIGTPATDVNHLKIVVLEFMAAVMGACMETGRDPGVLFRYGLEWVQQMQVARDQKQLEAIWEMICGEVFGVTPPADEVQVIERAKQFLSEHFAEDLSLAQIARQQFLSPFYFSRLFKQVTGVTVMDYLTGLRLQAARELLVRSDQPVSQIAGAVGYADPNYFSRVFRRHVGVSPSEYRSRFVNSKFREGL